MKCFNHQSVDAVAVCKNCYKGLCAECAHSLANGMACKDHCSGEVEKINSMISRSQASLDTAQKSVQATYEIY